MVSVTLVWLLIKDLRQMSKTRRRSLLVSLLTASLELMVFCGCSVLMAQRTLVAARWLVGAGGATVNFVLNRRWAFGRRDVSSRRQGLRYAVTAFSTVCLGTFIWWLGLISTHWDPRVLHMLSMIIVWLTFTYPMFKRWVFQTPASVA